MAIGPVADVLQENLTGREYDGGRKSYWWLQDLWCRMTGIQHQYYKIVSDGGPENQVEVTGSREWPIYRKEETCIHGSWQKGRLKHLAGIGLAGKGCIRWIPNQNTMGWKEGRCEIIAEPLGLATQGNIDFVNQFLIYVSCRFGHHTKNICSTELMRNHKQSNCE